MTGYNMSISEIDQIVLPRVQHHPRSYEIVDLVKGESISGKLEFDGWWWDEKGNRLSLTVQYSVTQWNDGYGIRDKYAEGRSLNFDLTNATFEGFSWPWMERVVITTPTYVITVYLPMPLSS